MKKADWGNFEEQFKQVISAPDNGYIPRCENAGQMVDGYLIMHNGLKVLPGFYGDYTRVLEVNRGVHEPQEERVFSSILPRIQPGSVIIELGASWSFYSMWFYKEVKDAKCYMIEPDEKNISYGKSNFALNGIKGEFTLGKIGAGNIRVDDFLQEKGIDHVDILHSDIQGAEFEMLLSAEQTIKKQKVDYFFISSHSQELHYKCFHLLRKNGYKIIASADFDRQTYSHDGILIARAAKFKGLGHVNIGLARWDTGNIVSDTIFKICPQPLIGSMNLFYYNHQKAIDNIRSFLLSIVPKRVKSVIKRFLSPATCQGNDKL